MLVPPEVLAMAKYHHYLLEIDLTTLAAEFEALAPMNPRPAVFEIPGRPIT
jgi:hypothetical protein